MRIWLIVGLTDERWIPNVISNYRRLASGSDCQMVVVENGARFPAGPWHVIASDRGAANYINAGLAFVRLSADPGDWFAKIDQDDYYGAPRASAIVEAASRGASAAGAVALYCSPSPGSLWYAAFPAEPWAAIPEHVAAHGPTLCSRVDCALDFPQPDARGWGEDLLWVDAMRSAGHEITALPPEGFCWFRHGSDASHAFPVTGPEIRHLWQCEVIDCGPWIESKVDSAPVEGPKVPVDSRIRRSIVGRLLKGNSMQTIHVPFPVPIAPAGADLSSATRMTFRDFLMVLCGRSTLTSGKVGGPAILLAARVTEACEGCPESGEWQLEDEHIAALRSALDSRLPESEAEFNPAIRFRLAPFVGALS
jgi:hypothetical protein